MQLAQPSDTSLVEPDPTVTRMNKIEMMRWQRCLWYLIGVAFCLLLDYPIGSQQQDGSGSAIYIENYANHRDCNTYATLGKYFNNEAGKNITCPYLLQPTTTTAGSMQESSEPPSTSSTDPGSCAYRPDALHLPNGSVSWYYEATDYITRLGKVTLYIDPATGERTVNYSITESNETGLADNIEKIDMLGDGQLHLPERSFTYFLLGATVKCSVLTEDGDRLQLCDVGFRVLNRRDIETEDGVPSIESAPSVTDDTELYFGQQLKWCVSGDTLGVHDLQWVWSLDPNLETVNISASIVSKNPCLDCACAESEYYSTSIVQDYLRNKTVDGARGVAFSVLGYELLHSETSMDFQCSGVPTNYLSFVIIDGVEPSDELTELMFNVTSFTGATTEDKYLIHAFYKQFPPDFGGDFTQETPQEHHLHFCSASIPGDANLEWRTGSIPIPIISSIQFPSSSDLSFVAIDNLCQEHNEAFSVRFDGSYMTDSSRAVFLNQEIALVLCNDHQSPASITYTCYSTSNGSAVGPTFTIDNPDSPSTFASYHIIVPVVVTVVVIVALLLAVLVVYLRLSRVKAKPPQMCPITTPAID